MTLWIGYCGIKRIMRINNSWPELFDFQNSYISARDVARHFQRHGSTISRLLNKLGTSRTDSDRADCVEPRCGKTVFSRLHLDAIDFFLVES